MILGSKCSNCAHWNQKQRRTGECSELLSPPLYNIKKGIIEHRKIRTLAYHYCMSHTPKELSQ